MDKDRFVVITNKVLEGYMEATKFEEFKEASDYVRELWEIYKSEMIEDGYAIDEKRSFCTDLYAKVQGMTEDMRTEITLVGLAEKRTRR